MTFDGLFSKIMFSTLNDNGNSIPMTEAMASRTLKAYGFHELDAWVVFGKECYLIVLIWAIFFHLHFAGVCMLVAHSQKPEVCIPVALQKPEQQRAAAAAANAVPTLSSNNWTAVADKCSTSGSRNPCAQSDEGGGKSDIVQGSGGRDDAYENEGVERGSDSRKAQLEWMQGKLDATWQPKFCPECGVRFDRAPKICGRCGFDVNEWTPMRV